MSQSDLFSYFDHPAPAQPPVPTEAAWIAPPNSSRCSVKVVLPASGWEMIAKVRLRAASLAGVLLMGAGVAKARPQGNSGG